ncbi:MAG: membrane dipeptidase [Chloroflexota bacterium]|nr:membrane dipeptidase [Chloroflexota bacterium]
MSRVLLVIVLLSVFLSMSVLAQEGSKQPNTDLKLADGFMEVHKELIAIDGCIPLVSMTRDPEHLKWFKDGGVTVASVSVSGPPKDPELTTDIVSWFAEQIQTNDDYVLIRDTDDILKAKKENKLGLFYHCQSPIPFRENLDRVWYYKALGVGMVQLAYNARSPYANGITERVDGGISDLGIKLVKALNEARIIVDVSHTGEQSTLDIIEASSEPVVLSHGNARGLIDNPRNVSDKVLKAVANNGGLAGVVGYPPFVSKSSSPSMDDMLDMVDYMVEVMGIDHVAFSLDYDATMHGVLPDEQVKATYDFYVSTGTWDPKAYPPPPYYYPQGIERPNTLYNLTGALLARGYSKEDVAKLWGGNWMRVMKIVWDDPKAEEVQYEQPAFIEQ